MQRTALAADDRVLTHDPGTDHPERPARYTAVKDAFQTAGLFSHPAIVNLPPRLATREELLLVHTAEYLDLVEREVRDSRPSLSTGDTDISAGSHTAALAAAGAALQAVDAVCGGRAANAFCLVRPPGHHASASRGMGFCLFNNIALGARYAQQRFHLERVLIIDWDVHHGNGTEDVFLNDASVLFFSSHEWPLYPGTGGRSQANVLNCPLPAGSGQREIFDAFYRTLSPRAETFAPELILISAGFDSRHDDPLGHFQLEDDDFRALTMMVRELADRHAQGRIVSILEGGYNLDGLARAATAHVQALLADSSYD